MEMKLLPVLVDESVEGHAVSPAGGEVVNVYVGIPEEKRRHHFLLLGTVERVQECSICSVDTFNQSSLAF